MRRARIAVFDSGLGGLTVFRELRRRLPEAQYAYIADRAAFPYGGWQEDALVVRLLALFERLIAAIQPDIIVIACNTASTIALKPLRERFSVPFVGTVPAIKVAAERSTSGLFSVLATPGTVQRDYTRELIRKFADCCEVTLVGAPRLAAMAEGHMRGETLRFDDLRREIAPAFIDKGGRRTDAVVLGCTHFPLVLEDIVRAAPWPVSYIDPAPAIARRTEQVLSEVGRLSAGGGLAEPNRFLHTDDGAIEGDLANFLRALGFSQANNVGWLTPEAAAATNF